MTIDPTVVWGISALSHDASLAVISGSELVFAAHSERYSRTKNDPFLHERLIAEALEHGAPDVVAWYERPILKKWRHLRAGQWRNAAVRSDLPNRYLQSLHLPFRFKGIDHYSGHHRSHRAAGMSSSGFEDAVVITADSIGEFETFTITRNGREAKEEELYRLAYPHSLGLLYSAFTRRCGFRPNEDEYVIMGMASFGTPRYADAIYDELVELQSPGFRLKFNPHRGIGDWMSGASPEDLAASIQLVTEDVLVQASQWAHKLTGCSRLVLAGGIALNCVANTRIARESGFSEVWIFPNPGDAGSSFGAAVDALGVPVAWRGPYLGTNIVGEYPVDRLLRGLLNDGVVGVANGRAEFGPRALGNRSIFADPRGLDMKDRVNGIKGREPFRPFAPVVREERAHEFFAMPVQSSPYMQFTSICLFPDDLPAVTHVDGTSRVQTVGRNDHPGLYELLLKWEEVTGCAVLLNTSLNGRSEPLVNSRNESEAFSRTTGLSIW